MGRQGASARQAAQGLRWQERENEDRKTHQCKPFLTHYQVAKLQKKGQGAPVREPVVDQDAYKNMLSFYHKKQEEMKKLEDNSEDAYLNSAWADPKALKRDLTGAGTKISWKPR